MKFKPGSIVVEAHGRTVYVDVIICKSVQARYVVRGIYLAANINSRIDDMAYPKYATEISCEW